MKTDLLFMRSIDPMTRIDSNCEARTDPDQSGLILYSNASYTCTEGVSSFKSAQRNIY